MPKVLCTLPNASDEINGYKFVTHAKGMLSEDLADDVAASFAGIPGYEIVGAAPDDEAAKAAAADKAAAASATASEKADLIEKLTALGVTAKNSWGLERLRAEVDAATKDAEAKAAAEKEAADQAAADKAAAEAGAK